MTDRPILFNGDMVRALLDGRKTQTRRVISRVKGVVGPIHSLKNTSFREDCSWEFWDQQLHCHNLTTAALLSKLPYAVGDRLYVREAWRVLPHLNPIPPRDLVLYMNTVEYVAGPDRAGNFHRDGKFRQGMHMPRWASRLTLVVTDVRVQRLTGISEEDAKAEGAYFHDGGDIYHSGWRHDSTDVYESARSSFRHLWDSINEKRNDGLYQWSNNPWVISVAFEVHNVNIDRMSDG